VVKIKVEGGPRGCRGGDDDQTKTKTDFCGECWSCGGCHRSDRCEFRWKRQLANAVRRLVQVGKDDSWIASEVRDLMGQVRRTKQPGPAAVKVVELPRPRPKEGGAGVQASVHAIAEERQPKTKTVRATTTGGMAKDEVTGPGDMAALQRQVGELTGQVRDLKVQRVSTNREIKLQRAWVEGEMKERAMAAQVQQAEERMEALEAGLAAQVQRAEESRLQIESQRLWVEGELRGGAMAVQVEKRMKVLEWGLASHVIHAAESMSEIRLQHDAEGSRWEKSLKHLCSITEDIGSQANQRNKSLLEEGRRLQGRLRAVEDRPDMTERLESVERSVQVCVNSVRVLHSYVEAKGSSDSDSEGT